MNTKEKELFQTINNLLLTLKEENNKFREDVKNQVEIHQEKISKITSPLNFEKEILSTIQSSMSNSITEVLKGYGSPLNNLIKIVLEENSEKLKKIISESFDEVIELEEFKNSIRNAFSHKISRSIISNNDGLFDKVSEELKKDSVFKSKMTLAIAKVVDECLNSKSYTSLL